YVVLASAERNAGDLVAAKVALDRVLGAEPENVAALMERADLLIDQKNYEAAIVDLKAADKVRPKDKSILGRLAYVYQQAGKLEEAQTTARDAGLEVQQPTGGNSKTQVVGTPAEIEAANSEDPNVARPAIEKLLAKNPRSATLLARLGASYRKE